ncbi:MAG: hypothetical protein ICV68_17305, partial [Pyrinomonadaceae bacterium]|nr:hypothetical protein [Pyrinomonadaceae bacterium]
MSLLNVDNPSVLLSTWKQAEDEDGTILRFIDLGGQRSRVSLNSPLLTTVSAQSCNAVEECNQTIAAGAGNLNFDMGPRQIYTLRLKTTRSKEQAGSSITR